MPKLDTATAARTKNATQRETRRSPVKESTRSLKGTPDLKSSSEQLDFLFGERSGFVNLCVGRKGTDGRLQYRNAGADSVYFAWPSERDDALKFVSEHASDDVTVCVNLLTDKVRKAVNVESGDTLWIDVDAKDFADAASLAEVRAWFDENGTVVESGSGGFHGYVKLPNVVDAAELRRLNDKLVDRFHGDKARRDVSSLLRVAGCTNNKGDDAKPVVLARVNSTPVDVTDVESWQADKPVADKVTTGVDFDALPKPLIRTMDTVKSKLNIGAYGGGLSDARNALVKACAQYGVRESVARELCEHMGLYDSQERSHSFKTNEVERLYSAYLASTGESKSRAASLWEPMNIADGWDEPIVAPERVGVAGLFYRAKTHWIAGEPASGKSFLAYDTALREIRDGKRVALIDEEAGIAGFRAPMKALGMTATEAKSMLYFGPCGRDIVAGKHELWSMIEEHDIGVLILDSAAVLAANAGLDENSNTDMTKLASVLNHCAQELGCMVLVIDHVTKASDARGKYARGAGAKLAATEVAYNVVQCDPFKRGKSGAIKVECTKDRTGYTERGHTVRIDVRCKADESVSFVYDGTTVAIQEHIERQSATAIANTAKGKIIAFLSAHPDAEQTVTAVVKGTGCTDEVVRKRLRELVKDGHPNIHSESIRGGATIYTWKPTDDTF